MREGGPFSVRYWELLSTFKLFISLLVSLHPTREFKGWPLTYCGTWCALLRNVMCDCALPPPAPPWTPSASAIRNAIPWSTTYSTIAGFGPTTPWRQHFFCTGPSYRFPHVRPRTTADSAARVARNRRRTPPHATEHHILGCRQTRTNYAMAAAFFLYRSQLPAPVIQYIYGTVFFLSFFKS